MSILRPLLQTILLLILPTLLANFNTSPRQTALFSGTVLRAATPEPGFPPITKLRELQHSLPPFDELNTVVIDAGHGGHDPGCLGSNSREKHIALAIALNLAEQIRLNFPEVEVVLTRDKDVFVPLHERARIANRHNADLFISIHCNFFPHSSRVNGSETYVLGMHRMQENLDVAMRENATILLEEDYETHYDYDPNSPEGHIMLAMYQNAYLDRSIRFADFVENRMQEDTHRKSRGVRQAGFLVLRATAMPSVLIETGYLSNRAEEGYLLTEAGQQQVATAIMRAFTLYKSELEGVVAEAFEPTPPPRPVQEPQTPPPAVEQIPEPAVVAETIKPATPVATPPAPAEQISEKGFTEPEFDLPASRPAPVQLRIQLAASPRPLDTQQGAWQNIPYQVQVIEEGGYYKYQARSFSSMTEAQAAQKLLQQQGFTDAFIVAYRGTQRITIAEARKALKRPPSP